MCIHVLQAFNSGLDLIAFSLARIHYEQYGVYLGREHDGIGHADNGRGVEQQHVGFFEQAFDDGIHAL